MGRRRKSKLEHELSGAFEKHPERKAQYENEPKPTGPIGDPPARFLKENSPTAARELEAWNELMAMVPPGVLTSSDRWACERMAYLMAKSRYTALKASEENALKDYLGRYACGGADRSKVVVSTGAGTVAKTAHGDSGNKFDKFATAADASPRPN